MAVPRDYNPYALPTTQQYAAPYSDGSLDDLVASKNTILQGATVRTSNFAGRTVTVGPGENIGAAIETLRSAGGGTLFLRAGTHTVSDDILGSSRISIIGDGRAQTIIEFTNAAYGIKYIGTSGAIVENFVLQGFTVSNSNATAGIEIDYADYWQMVDVRTTSCDQKGIRVRYSQYFSMRNVRSDNNTGNGFEFTTDNAVRRCEHYQLDGLLSDSNGGVGYYFTSTSGQEDSYLYACDAESNTGDGFALTGSDTGARLNLFGCQSGDNGGDGFDIDSNGNTLFYCNSTGCTGNAFADSGSTNVLLSCSTSGATGYYLTRDGTATKLGTVINFRMPQVSPPTTKFDIGTTFTQSLLNSVQSPKTEKNFSYMLNESGGALADGNVVVYGTNANGQSVTTTTTGGDKRVYGVAMETIANNGYGNILTMGFTNTLKVDGTTDIAVGDFLSCFTTAGIAKKAAAGEMVFAIALEAYTTNDSNGVIDAIIISPRLI